MHLYKPKVCFHAIEGSVDVIRCLAVDVIRYLATIYYAKKCHSLELIYLVITYPLCIRKKKKRLALNPSRTNIHGLGLTGTEAMPFLL